MAWAGNLSDSQHIESGFGEGKVFQMYGDDYPTRDTTCIQDYINVKSGWCTYQGIGLAGSRERYNHIQPGDYDGSTVKEVFAVCETVCNLKIAVEIQARRAGDPAVLVADNRKAKNSLGWKPVKTLYNSVESALRWEKRS